MHIKHLVIPLLIILSLAGCASVSLVKSWKNPNVPQNSYRSFLVVGISQNRQMRQVFEEVLSGELRKSGVAAIPSYTVIGIEEPLSRESIVKAVRAKGAEAVMTTRVVDRQRDTRADVGYAMTSRGVIGPVSFATFDLKPVEVTTSTNAMLETNLFDTATQKLAWTGVSNAVDPESIIKVSEEFAGVVIKALSKESLIP